MRTEHIAVLGVLTEIAVVDPVRVLHGQTGIAHGPILSIYLSLRIVTFVHLDIRPVVTTGKEVGTYDWVVIETLIHHVAVSLMDIARIEVESHLILKEACGVAYGEVVTVITVVGDHTL